MEIMDLNEYGFNALSNMMVVAKYISLGGGIITRYDQCKYEMCYFTKEGSYNDPMIAEERINISDALLVVYSLMKSDITEIGFFIDDVYKVYTTTNEMDRLVYINTKHKDGMNLQRSHIIFELDEFINKIKNVKNNNIESSLEDFNNLFDIGKGVQQEAALNVLHYNKSSVSGESLDIPI